MVKKLVDSSINYINIFQNAKALEIPVVNNYSEDQLMHTILDNFQKGVKYLAQKDRHQAELRRGKTN